MLRYTDVHYILAMRNSKSGIPSGKARFSQNKNELKLKTTDQNKLSVGQSRRDVNKNANNHEVIQYFSEIFNTMEEGFKDENGKGYFVANVLEQTVGKEVELSCHHLTSHCIEKLFDDCSDPYVAIRFMEAFSHNLGVVCVDKCASHIVEKLLQITLLIMKNLPSATEPSDVREKENIKTACLFWAYKLGQFCCQNLELCLNDTYGCHVLSAVIQFLGCCRIDEGAVSGKKLHGKERSKEKHAGHENLCGVTEIFSTIPEIFKDLLKQIYMGIVECKQLSDLIFDSRSSHVIQVMLLILKKRNLRSFKKIKQILLSVIFSNRNHEGIPLTLFDSSCSYLVEKIVELSDEHEQELVWMGINQCLPQLISSPVGNHIIQKFFNAVHSKEQFESMLDATIDHFEDILKNQYFGIWLSIAKSCNRLKTRQIQLLTKLIQVLKCPEPIEKNSCFVLLLLGLETYEQQQKKKSVVSQPSSLRVNLFGSLILQEILKFSKPFKVVRSILTVTPEMLKSIACEKQGSFVLIKFLESMSIARKDKDKLIQLLKPEVVSIACDFTGNFTLCQMWPLLSVEQKHIVGKELCEKKTVIQKNKWGAVILKKFAIFHFEHDIKKWKEIQQSWEKKKQMFKEIIS